MSRQGLYKSKAWKQNRIAFAISKYCICERCGRAVYVSGVNDYLPKEQRLRYIVHHKEYLNDNNYTDDTIAYDWDNLELLCIDCHNKEHTQKVSAIRTDLEFDENGNLVQRKQIKRKTTPLLT